MTLYCAVLIRERKCVRDANCVVHTISIRIVGASLPESTASNGSVE